MSVRLDFIGVGAAKTGTTWYAKCLSEHPDVFVPDEKELNYFCRDYLFWRKAPTNFEKGAHWFNQRFAERAEGQQIGEVSPIYLWAPEAPHMIYNHNPDIKIIVSFRDPLAIFASLWVQLCKTCDVPDTFDEFLADNPYYWSFLHFEEQVQRYLALFDRQQLYFTSMDAIRASAGDVIRDIFGFVGVDPNFSPPSLNTRVNTKTEPRSKGLRNIISNSIDGMNKSKGGRVLKDCLRAVQVHKLVDKISAANQAAITEAPLSDAVRERIVAESASSLGFLEELLQQDLSSWQR